MAEISPWRRQLRQGVHKDGGGADAHRQALHHEPGPERVSRLLLHKPWVYYPSLRGSCWFLVRRSPNKTLLQHDSSYASSESLTCFTWTHLHTNLQTQPTPASKLDNYLTLTLSAYSHLQQIQQSKMQTADCFSCWLVTVELFDHVQKTAVLQCVVFRKPRGEQVNVAHSIDW